MMLLIILTKEMNQSKNNRQNLNRIKLDLRRTMTISKEKLNKRRWRFSMRDRIGRMRKSWFVPEPIIPAQ